MTPNPAADLDLTPLIGLGVKLVLVALVLFVGVGLARSWWHNRTVAAPPRARGGAVEPVARVLRGSSTVWDEQLISFGLFGKKHGQVVRPRIVEANRSAVKILPLPGSVPRWLHPATAAHLIQIANHPVQVGQVGSYVVIQVG